MEDVLYVPVEALHVQGDSISYVYKKDGLSTVKQEVVLGQSNSDEVIVLNGLEEDDVVYLSDPEGMEDKELRRLESSTEQLTAQY